MKTKKIGILGSGIVGQVLATGFKKHGYHVTVGTGHPEKLQEWKNKNSGIHITDFEEAVKSSDIIVLALKGTIVVDLVSKLNHEYLKGKTVIDATNPIDDQSMPENGVIKFFTANGESLMQKLQNAVPGANFVKAFNSVGNVFMVDPDFNGIKPTMFICGNNEDAKLAVKEILDDFGWEVEDMGMVNAAGSIESLCILWCIPGMLNNKWNHAFKLLKT